MSDSDSDIGSDAGSYTTTQVLLGYAESKPPAADPISQLGGLPTWLHPSSPADPRLAKCRSCNGLMTMLLQLDARLDKVRGERRVWVYACTEKKCRRKEGSVRAWRGIRIDPKERAKEEQDKKEKEERERREQEERAKQPMLGNAIFGGGPAGGAQANPFSMGGAPAASSNPFSTGPTPNGNPFSSQPAAPIKPATGLSDTFASKLALNNPTPAPVSPQPTFFGPAPPWPASPPSFPPSYLDAEYEELSKPSLPPVNIPIETEYEDETPSAGGSSKDEVEGELDKDFQKFADRAAENPEQVLRYYGSPACCPPLLYNKKDAVGKLVGKGVPRCPECGGKREVEVQLMPFAISVLEGEEVGFEGMEWGTILVGTCRCASPKSGFDANGVWYGEEWVGVQWEHR